MKLLSRTLLSLLVAVMAFSLIGCTVSPATEPSQTAKFDGKIDWMLHGVWVAADGTVQTGQESVEFFLCGTLPTEYEMYDTVEMELNFIWPETVDYKNEGMMTYVGGAGVANKHNDQPIYHGAGWLYDLRINESTSLGFTVCPDEGFVVVHIGSQYLVASTDPNADPAEIFAFYKEYVHVSQ